ncbi:hypothetical protein, partial [Nocardia wallacei]|uniref:hypothetical protein n=1 Tax=Nocardia wallacei TaxID=480035 RepID=UPI002458D161
MTPPVSGAPARGDVVEPRRATAATTPITPRPAQTAHPAPGGGDHRKCRHRGGSGQRQHQLVALAVEVRVHGTQHLVPLHQVAH